MILQGQVSPGGKCLTWGVFMFLSYTTTPPAAEILTLCFSKIQRTAHTAVMLTLVLFFASSCRNAKVQAAKHVKLLAAYITLGLVSPQNINIIDMFNVSAIWSTFLKLCFRIILKPCQPRHVNKIRPHFQAIILSSGCLFFMFL